MMTDINLQLSIIAFELGIIISLLFSIYMKIR